MEDELDAVRGSMAAGVPLALATVVRTWQSSPRPAGAVMAVTATGEVIGSVSGGCVEAAVHETCSSVLRGAPARIEHYGVSDDDAFAVGLTCGGFIDVFVDRADARHETALAALATARADRRSAVFCTVISGPHIGSPVVHVGDDRPSDGGRATLAGTTGSEVLDRAIARDAAALLASRDAAAPVLTYGADGEPAAEGQSVFFHPIVEAPDLLVFGATDFARALSQLGRLVGHRVTVCDARPVFATAARFPEADDVVADWPDRFLARTAIDERTAICVLTHDPKFDVPTLTAALRSPAGYVGAMGSRRTHDDRLRRLAAAGVTSAELERLRSPIGLDLGASTPQETAIAILAEIIAVRTAASGRPLRDTAGPIHGAGRSRSPVV